MIQKPPKPKNCKVCKARFTPSRRMQIACAPPCAVAYASRVSDRKAKDQRKVEAKKDRAKAEELKTVPVLKKEAQHAFNAYIRERDRQAGYSCICCCQPLRWGELGGAVDAGHYRSTGSADHLRFNEDNCHAQLAQCNRYGAGRAVDYRLGLIQRIGLARVESLESANIGIKWTREGLREIRDKYRAKLKTMTKCFP